MDTEIVVLSDNGNQLMKRNEVRVILRNAAGKLKRNEVVELIAKKNKVNVSRIVPIMMKGSKGKTDLEGLFHIYDKEETIKKILPRYRALRMLSKEERKKIIDEEKAKKLKAKQMAVEKKSTKK